MKNVTPINFSYEGYKGYVGETSYNGMKQKGVIFSKDKRISYKCLECGNSWKDYYNKKD